MACAIVHDVQPCAACARVGRREHSGELGHTPDARRTPRRRVEARMHVHAACAAYAGRAARPRKSNLAQPSLATRAQEERRNRARSCALHLAGRTSSAARQPSQACLPGCQAARPLQPANPVSAARPVCARDGARRTAWRYALFTASPHRPADVRCGYFQRVVGRRGWDAGAFSCNWMLTFWHAGSVSWYAGGNPSPLPLSPEGMLQGKL